MTPMTSHLRLCKLQPGGCSYLKIHGFTCFISFQEIEKKGNPGCESAHQQVVCAVCTEPCLVKMKNIKSSE